MLKYANIRYQKVKAYGIIELGLYSLILINRHRVKIIVIQLAHVELISSVAQNSFENCRLH